MTTTNTIPATATTKHPAVGQVVEFVTTHPNARGQRIFGYVRDVGTPLYPCNPSVDTRVGGHELIAREWGKSVIVVREKTTYADFRREFVG